MNQKVKIMPWNHRIMRHVQTYPGGESEASYGIVEAHYHKKGDKIPHSWTEGFVAPYGETLEELVSNFAWMLAALRHPVLDDKGVECEPAKMLADDIQQWVNAAAEMKDKELH